MPARTVALTFDDGPDPAWTPKVLAILRHYRVPGTFFLVGAHVASYPGLVREEEAVRAWNAEASAPPRAPVARALIARKTDHGRRRRRDFSPAVTPPC